MPDLSDHERRITTLEGRVDFESGLRAAQDRDLSSLTEEVRANTKLLKALSATQSDHGRKLTGLERDVAGLKTDVAELKTDVAGLKTDVAELKVGMGTVTVGVHKILGLLDRLVDEDERS